MPLALLVGFKAGVCLCSVKSMMLVCAVFELTCLGSVVTVSKQRCLELPKSRAVYAVQARWVCQLDCHDQGVGKELLSIRLAVASTSWHAHCDQSGVAC